MARCYPWQFPLPRTHTGMLLGNGTTGAMIWGEGRHLKITIGRADFWDHRGGLQWTPQQNYPAIRDCLERRDEPGLRKLFESTGSEPGIPARPSVIPVGRIDLMLPPDAALTSGVVDMDRGEVNVLFTAGGSKQTLTITMDMTCQLIGVALPAGGDIEVVRFPAWELLGEQLAAISFDPPELYETADMCGWTQMRPVDPTLCVATRHSGNELMITTALGDDATAARQAAGKQLAGASMTAIRERTQPWWEAYWETVPVVELPNDRLAFLHDYGMYKFAGLTHPDGIAATLQGPWIEEYQLPPWSSDYHFNINVQMCYWPAYHGNRLDHLKPLWALIDSWQDQLKRNAHCFLGIDDGVMLPHAVSDRCTCMGGFWTGTVDHGCTAWVAQMMYRYYRYTMDEDFLRDQAFAFMKGAMRVYEEMLERDGDSFVLPLSVSPEYGGSGFDAWGANASFQLACIHRLCEDLVDAAAVLGEEVSPIWLEVLAKCPKASIFDSTNALRSGQRIGLWDGTDLERSHRHHSHLAGIAPFDIIDIDDPEWSETVTNSLAHWIAEGPGEWSGWCIPWASMIHSRVGNGDAAELWLELWQRVYTNIGHGTLHDVDYPGFSLTGKGPTMAGHTKLEIMQMDAGMSCTAAIHEILLHQRRGVNYLFRGVPARWPQAAFTGIRTDGGFLVSGSWAGGTTVSVEVDSPYGGTFRLANPWAGAVTVTAADGTSQTLSGEILELATDAGTSYQIVSA